MKQGKSLVELATEIERQAKTKQDFVVGTGALSVTVASPSNGREARLAIEGHGDFAIRPIAHDQIATRLKVPSVYYDRLLEEQPDEWARHVTERLHHANERRMVRTLDGAARSFLSDRYHRRDNFELSEVLLPVLMGTPGLLFESAEITERRLYIKVVTDRLTGEVKRGDPVRAGAIISNSEVGSGSTSIQALIERLVCLNGMVVPDYSSKKYHVGKQVEEEGALESMYRDETLRADDRAFWLKLRDVLQSVLNDVATFDRMVERMRKAAGELIVGNPLKAVEVLGNKLALSEGEQTSVLRLLIQGKDLSRYGLLNAVTQYAGADEVTSYDRATELETLGGRVLTLSDSEWKEVSEAAA